MILKAEQRYALAELIQEAIHHMAAVARAGDRHLPGYGTGFMASYRAEFLDDAGQHRIKVADYVWRIGQAFEQLPLMIFRPDFDPLLMCRQLMRIEGPQATHWSRLAQRAAALVDYELPPYQAYADKAVRDIAQTGSRLETSGLPREELSPTPSPTIAGEADAS